jgi:hypothetical protein
MVYNNLDRKPGPFKVIVLILKGFNNRKQLPIMSAIVTFGSGEFPGPEYYWMLVFFRAITRINLL